MKKFSQLCCLMGLLILAPTSAVAHDPAQHGFRLTTFEPPFPAPDFQLSDLQGVQTSLQKYRGHYVLLNFWATWCPPCLAEMPSMQAIFERYETLGFVVVAVSSDLEGKAIVQPYVDKLGVTFPILLDDKQQVSEQYGAINLPLSLLLNRQGQVIAGAEGARDWNSEEAISVLDELIMVQ